MTDIYGFVECVNFLVKTRFFYCQRYRMMFAFSVSLSMIENNSKQNCTSLRITTPMEHFIVVLKSTFIYWQGNNYEIHQWIIYFNAFENDNSLLAPNQLNNKASSLQRLLGSGLVICLPAMFSFSS